MTIFMQALLFFAEKTTVSFKKFVAIPIFLLLTNMKEIMVPFSSPGLELCTALPILHLLSWVERLANHKIQIPNWISGFCMLCLCVHVHLMVKMRVALH